MSKAKASDANPQGLTTPVDEDLASFPAPPPLPGKRAPLAKSQQETQDEPPPLTKSGTQLKAQVSPKPPAALKTPAPRRSPQGKLQVEPPLEPSPSKKASNLKPKQNDSPVSSPVGFPAQPLQRLWAAQKPRFLIGLAALLVLGVGTAAYLLIDRPKDSGTDKKKAPQQAEETPETNLIDEGRLLIDAKPWGEVTSLLDSDGTEIPLPSDRQTPLVIALDPGRYTVFLTHPELIDQQLPCEVEVLDAVGASCRLDLLSVTSEDYWEDVKWWG